MKRYVLIAAMAALLSSQIGRAESGPASFAYVLQSDSLAKTRSAAAEKLAASSRDWIILDAYFSGDELWERADLDAIRKARPGRKILAYLSIGEAEDYRPYWHKEWGGKGKLAAAAPSWLGKENPDWKGNYRVNYWRLEWQALILAAVDDAISRSFDGVYLDIVDAFESYEQDGEDFIDDRPNPETKQTFRRDMVDWVKTIAARARAKNADALVVPQNGSQLLEHPDFLEAVSAIGIEDLFTEGDKLQPQSHTSEVLDHLHKMADAHKPVLVIEYPKRAERQTLAQSKAKENGFICLVTDRDLKTLGASGK